MFSYRHAFHAGNHADVLKHLTLIATLRHLMHKDAGLQFVDTHAGAGLYRLDGDYAEKSGEAADGVLKLKGLAAEEQVEALKDYLSLVASFNDKGSSRVYPGSSCLSCIPPTTNRSQAILNNWKQVAPSAWRDKMGLMHSKPCSLPQCRPAVRAAPWC